MSRDLERTYSRKAPLSNEDLPLFAYIPPTTDKDHYPNSPGYKAEGTSRDAAKAVSHAAKEGALKVLAALREYGAMTADEIAVKVNRDRLYVRPRLSELGKLGLVRKTKEKRPNDSGLMATVIEAV